MKPNVSYRLATILFLCAISLLMSLALPTNIARAVSTIVTDVVTVCKDGFRSDLTATNTAASDVVLAAITGSTPSSSTGTVLSASGVGTFSGSFTALWSTPQIPGASVTINGVITINGVTYPVSNTFTVADCTVSTAQFYNPNDGRVDPHPWDRLAIWCNTSANPPTLDIWGVGNDSSGFRLLRLVFADLARTGNLSRATGRLGSLLITVDAQNNFTVVWKGQVNVSSGSFVADGNPDHGFAKFFRCGFAR